MHKITKFPDGSHRDYGSYDTGRRWSPAPEIIVSGSFHVREPSRAYPFSYLKHFYSIKFAKLLAQENPKLYCKVAGISSRRKAYKEILAAAVARRLG